MQEINTRTVTTTREIAELGNKKHSEVLQELRDVQKNISSKDYRSLWNISRYKDYQGRNCMMYKVTKKGWLLLLKNYEANARLQMIDKCLQEDNTLHEQLKTQQVLAERAWDKVDRNDLYRQVN